MQATAPLIRKLREQDWILWKDIRLSALQQNPEVFGGSFIEESTWTDAQLKQSLEKSDIFGAFINYKLVACAGFFSLELAKMRHRGVLFGLYTNQIYRGQGIASKLINTVIEHARNKVIQLHISVTTDNTVAINLYQKHGFTIYATEPRALMVDGKFYDEYLMMLKFS